MVAIQYLHGQVRMVALPASSRTRAALGLGIHWQTAEEFD